MNNIPLLIPAFPLLGFLILSLTGKSLSKSAAAILGSGMILLSFLFSIFSLSQGDSREYLVFEWINAGALKANFSFLIDPLTSVFLLIITGIGFLIHVYSAAYMHDDEHHNTFFSYLNLFIFFMLLLVMGSNFLIMFVGWEGVGLCSYLLIGFWYKNDAYNKAASKAFIMNRIGDLGFLLGIVLIALTFGSLEYTTVFDQAKGYPGSDATITAITLLLFVGATGKSAQIPLYTWLPDAMAGPTPVSALIHAATMVTAGIYMVARSNILFTLSPITMQVVATTGIATAMLAATIGLAQNDIKKVLAYSTVSQLGLLFTALGFGAFGSAVFHVMTHAFFKACLFLGAGSVIHALHHQQDIRKMGGLRKYMPLTYLTFLISTLAIAGIFPFSGFFSKDEMLAQIFSHNRMFWLLGIIVSIFTAFYMFRLFYLTFHGDFRGTEKEKSHLHESPPAITIPLVVLALLALAGGLLGLPAVFHAPHFLADYLEPVFKNSHARVFTAHPDHATEWMLMGIAMLCALITIGVAYSKYIRSAEVPEPDEKEKKPLHLLVYRKYLIDELYDNIIVKPLQFLSGIFHRIGDKEIIDGSVNLTGTGIREGGALLKLLQTGNTGFYLLMMVIGSVLLLLLGML